MNINANFGNLANVIRSSFETTPIKEANKEINELDKNITKVNTSGVFVDPVKFMENWEKNNALKEMQNDLEKNKETINQVKETTKQATTELEKMSNIKTNNLNQELDKTDSKIKKITSTSSKNSNFGSSLKTALGIGTVALGIRKAFDFVKSSTSESVDFVEQQNLFNVSMGRTIDQYGNLDREASKYYLKATAFQEKLSEKLGINIAESMKYQALFNAMSKSMGIAEEYSYKLSENFTKLGYDLSSLYNIDPENIMQKLRAGLSGQTKPLRDLGLDITQQSLEPLLDELGIERSVKQLSQAEKMVARYIVVLRQASLAHGDFAKTMDSPANQLRIFNAQLVAFKRNMGNLWQGLLGNILPYVNAIMMVINELLKMVAKLFGFEISSQNANISTSIGADDLADDLGTATGKAKELKKQLMGFDEINNISMPDNSSGGSGGGASVGGIDQRLLDAMKEYDNLMDKVKNKATDIRDRIMKWLGFTKKINPLTGEISWELGKGNTNLKKIFTTTKLLAGLYIGAKVLKLVGYLKTLRDVLKGTKAPMTSFQNGLALIGKGTSNLWTWLKTGVEQFKLFRANGDNVTTSLGKTSKAMFDLIPNTVKVAGGIAGLVGSSVLAYKSMEDLSKGTIGTQEAMLKLTGGIAGATASGALIGSVFGPAGTAIGALTGLLISGTSAFAGYKDKIDLACEATKENRKSADEYLNSIKEQKQAIQESVNSQLAQIDYTQKLVSELDNLVDSNGKVKSGYEDRVKFILSQLSEATGQEWNLTDGIIEKYQELRGEINRLIDTKKAEIILNANQEEYANAIKRQIELQHKKIKVQEDLTNKTEAYNTKLSEIEQEYGSLDEARKQALNGGWLFAYDAKKAVDDLKQLEEAKMTAQSTYSDYVKQITDDNQLIIKWEDLKTATITGDTEKINAKVQEITNTYKTESGNQLGTIQEQISKEIDLAKERQKVWEDNGIEINKNNKEQLEIGIRTTADKLVEQTNMVEQLTPDQIGAWKTLAESSEKTYNEKIANVKEDTRLALELILGTITFLSAENIQKWADLARNDKQAYESNLSGLDETTRQRVQSCVDAVNSKQWSAEEASRGLARAVERGVNTIDTTEAGKQAVNGVARGIEQNKNNFSITRAINNFKNLTVNQMKTALGIHSPSTVMRDMVGKFIPLGIAEGIDNNANAVFSSIKNLNNGITKDFTVNPQDFKIDTNQFIDYGQISGAIATQSNVEVDSSLDSRIENAIYRGLSNATIPVEIQATTDEGVIFKKVQVKAREFYTQTGEPAFNF